MGCTAPAHVVSDARPDAVIDAAVLDTGVVDAAALDAPVFDAQVDAPPPDAAPRLPSVVVTMSLHILDADGTTPTAITVVATDAFGNVASDRPVAMAVSGTGNLLGATSGITDAQGVFTTTLASTVPEPKVITATVDGLAASASMTFVTPACTPMLPGRPVHPLPGFNFGMVTGDFDGDGILDAAAFDFAKLQLVVTFGHGDGTFRGEATTQLASRFRGFATADLDGDGNLDIAAIDPGTGLQILFGTGDGRFVAGPAIHVSTNQISVGVADFDHDGILDVALPSGILLGHGDGTFEPPTQLAPNGSPLSMAIGDLDRDGNLDLVVIDGGFLNVYLGDGSGGFGPAIRILDNTDVGQPTLGDVTGDGILDVLVSVETVTGPSPQQTHVLIGDGTGRFTSGPTTDLDISRGSLGACATLADLDGDGNLDILTCSAFQVALGRGDGTFDVLPPPALATNAIAVSDVDGDHLADIVFLAFQGIGVAHGLGDGRFVLPSYAVGSGVSTALYSGLADFNGDGFRDLPALGGAFLVQPDGSVARGPASSVAIASQFGAVGDFDEDGSPDLVLFGSPTSGSLAVALGNGDGSFRAGPSSTAAPLEGVFATGDFDGDGHLDVVIGSEAAGELLAELGTGLGTFVAASSPAVVPGALGALVVADFDRDGVDDIVAIGGSSVQFLRSSTGGTFAAPVVIAGPSIAGTAADLDNDGRIDLVLAPALVGDPPLVTGAVSVLFGHGDGTFAPPVDVVFGRNSIPKRLAVGDIDGDGTPDLLVMSENLFQVVQGYGDGTFRPPLVYALASGFAVQTGQYDFTLLDVDHDGHPDLVSDAVRPASDTAFDTSLLIAHQGVCLPFAP